MKEEGEELRKASDKEKGYKTTEEKRERAEVVEESLMAMAGREAELMKVVFVGVRAA